MRLSMKNFNEETSTRYERNVKTGRCTYVISILCFPNFITLFNFYNNFNMLRLAVSLSLRDETITYSMLTKVKYGKCNDYEN